MRKPVRLLPIEEGLGVPPRVDDAEKSIVPSVSATAPATLGATLDGGATPTHEQQS